MMNISWEITNVWEKNWGWEVSVKSLEDEKDHFSVPVDKHWFLPDRGLNLFMVKRAVVKRLRERQRMEYDSQRLIGEKLFK